MLDYLTGSSAEYIFEDDIIDVEIVKEVTIKEGFGLFI